MTKTSFLVKNIDGKNSFYFFSNSHSANNSASKLNELFFTFISLEKKLGEYEQLLKKHRETIEKLVKEFNDNQ